MDKSYQEESDEGIDYEQEEDDVENEGDETKTISVKVQGGVKGAKVELFKLERDIELRWLMVRYCDEFGLSHISAKFIFNGVRLRDTDTPLKLNMLDNDVIYVFPRFHERSSAHDERTAVCYGTLYIRMHKKKDMLVRVTRHEPLLHQLKRHFSNDIDAKYVSTCFLLNGSKLGDNSTMESCNLEDGDIIDAFNFEESSSSLSIDTPVTFTIKQHWAGSVHTFKVRRSFPMSRLVNKYAELTGIPPDDFSLMFEGRTLFLNKTVGEQLLFNGCQIICVLFLRGGYQKAGAN